MRQVFRINNALKWDCDITAVHFYFYVFSQNRNAGEDFIGQIRKSFFGVWFHQIMHGTYLPGRVRWK